VFLPSSELPDDWTSGARWMVVQVESLTDVTKDSIEDIRVAQYIVSDPENMPPTGTWKSYCGSWSEMEWTFNPQNTFSAGRRTLEATGSSDVTPSLMRRLLNAATASDVAPVVSRRVMKQ